MPTVLEFLWCAELRYAVLHLLAPGGVCASRFCSALLPSGLLSSFDCFLQSSNWIISSSVLSQRLSEPAITRFARLLLRAVSIKPRSTERLVSPQRRSFFARPIARFTLRTESAQQPDRPADPQDLAFLALFIFILPLILLQPTLIVPWIVRLARLPSVVALDPLAPSLSTRAGLC